MYIKERRKKKKFAKDPTLAEPTGRVDLLRRVPLLRSVPKGTWRASYTLIGSFDVTKIVEFYNFPAELIQQLSVAEQDQLREWFGGLLEERRVHLILDAASKMMQLAAAVEQDSCVPLDDLSKLENDTLWVLDALKKRLKAERKRLGIISMH